MADFGSVSAEVGSGVALISAVVSWRTARKAKRSAEVAESRAERATRAAESAAEEVRRIAVGLESSAASAQAAVTESRRLADAAELSTDAAARSAHAAEQAATYSKRSAEAAERSDERAAREVDRASEKNDVRWSSGWVSASDYAVVNLGTDPACDVRIELTMEGDKLVASPDNNQYLRSLNVRVEFDLQRQLQKLSDRLRRQQNGAGIKIIGSGTIPIEIRCSWTTPLGTKHERNLRIRIDPAPNAELCFYEWDAIQLQ